MVTQAYYENWLNTARALELPDRGRLPVHIYIKMRAWVFLIFRGQNTLM